VKTSTLIGLALIVGGLLAHLDLPFKQPQPSPERPSDALVTAVQPVAAILKGHGDDGGRLSAFYLAEADVVARDQGKVIATTAQLRELNRRSGLLMFQRTGIEGKYPGLAEAIDQVLADRVGLDNVVFDAGKQKAAVETLKALAWACAGGGQ
jgi:hypothetical protein